MRVVVSIKPAPGGGNASQAARYIAYRDRDEEREGGEPRKLFSAKENTLSFWQAERTLTEGRTPTKDEVAHLAVSLKAEDFQALGWDENTRQQALKEVTREALAESSMKGKQIGKRLRLGDCSTFSIVVHCSGQSASRPSQPICSFFFTRRLANAMKFLTHLLTLVLFSLLLPLQAQNGIRYKKAPDEINQQAITALEAVLQKKTPPEQVTAFFSDIVVCGPLLWEQLKKQGDKPLDGKPIFVMASGIIFNNEKKPDRLEARGFVTPTQVQAFQSALLNSIFPTEKYKMRKAEEKDIRYFWATIPFDIEEPLLVIETAQQRILLNFQIKEGKPKLYWVDYVGEVAAAKKE